MKKLLFLVSLLFIGNVEAVSLNTNDGERLNKGNTIQIYKNSTLPNYTSYICRKIQNTSGTDDVFIPLKTETEFQAFLNNSPAYLLKNVCQVTSSCTPRPGNSTVYTATNISQFSSDGVNWSPSNVSYHSNTSTTTTCAYRCNPGYFYNGSSCPAANPGYYAPGYGNTSQTPCIPGNYQPNSAQTTCINATPGYYVPVGAATTQTPASPGYYVNTAGSDTQTACTPGNYQPSSAQTTCITASPGNYVPGGASTNQIACSAGSYQPTSGQSSCISAGTGQYQDLSGQTTVKSCSNKPANSSYTSSSGLTSNSCPWTCNPNYHLEGGVCVFDFESQVASCSSKPANSYWNTVSSITQSRNWTGFAWSAWSPTTSTSYNASSSTSTCRYDCDNGYQNSGASCIPKNCPSTTIASYNVGSILHGGSTSTGKSYAISNGTMYCSQGFSCSFGSTSINGAETCSANCNSGYAWDGSQCQLIVVGSCNFGETQYDAMDLCTSDGATGCRTVQNMQWDKFFSTGNMTSCIGNYSCPNYLDGPTNNLINGASPVQCKTSSHIGLNGESFSCGCDASYEYMDATYKCIKGIYCGTKISYTYAWSTGGWGACSAIPTWSSWSACSGGTQSRTCSGTTGSQLRTVQCLRSDGAVVADSNCSGGKPSTFQSCTSSCSGVSLQSCTVAVNGTCGASVGSCITGTHNPFKFVPTDAINDYWWCDGVSGGTNIMCSKPKIATYTYAWLTGGWSTCDATPTWSSWSSCSGGNQTRTCSGTSGSQSRTVQCLRSDGNVVADANCTGGKPSTSQSCTSSCSGNSMQSCPSFDINTVVAGCYVDTKEFDYFSPGLCSESGRRLDGQPATIVFSVGDIINPDFASSSVPATISWGPGCTPGGSMCTINGTCGGPDGTTCPKLGSHSVSVTFSYGGDSRTFTIDAFDDTRKMSEIIE